MTSLIGRVDPDRGVVDVERLLRVVEGVLDVLLAQDVVPGAAAQAVGLGRAVGDDLVDDVEGDERVRALPNGPYMSLSVWATLKMWSCRRVRRIVWSAGEFVSGVPSSRWKNQSGVC